MFAIDSKGIITEVVVIRTPLPAPSAVEYPPLSDADAALYGSLPYTFG